MSEDDETPENVVARELEAWRNRHQIRLDMRSRESIVYDKFLHDGDVQVYLNDMRKRYDGQMLRYIIRATLDYALTSRIGQEPDYLVDMELLALLMGKIMD